MTFLQNDIFTQNAYIIKSTKYTIKVGVRKMKKLMTPAIMIFVLVLILPSISAAFSGQQEPNKPTLTGPTEVTRFKEYTYSAVTTDPQGDSIYYRFQFCHDASENKITDWLGPYPSGSEASYSYRWQKSGGSQAGAQAKDISGHESEWGSLEVNVSKLFDSSESSIPEQSETTVSSIKVTISLRGVIIQQITVPLYFNLINQQQQNPQ